MLRGRSQIDKGHTHMKTEELRYRDRKQPRVGTKVRGTRCDSLMADLRRKLRSLSQLKLPHTRFARFTIATFCFKKKKPLNKCQTLGEGQAARQCISGK